MKKVIRCVGIFLFGMSFCLISKTSFAIEITTTDSNTLKNQAFIPLKISPTKIHALLGSTACIKTEKVCYFASPTGILKMDSASHTSLIDNRYFLNNGIEPTVIYAKTSSQLYIGTNKGVYLAERQKEKNYLFKYVSAFGLEKINTLYVDSKGTIFAGTNGNGLQIKKQEPLANASQNTEPVITYLSSYYIQYTHVDSQGKIIVGANTQNSGESSVLWTLDEQQSYSLPNVIINSIDDSSGILKIGTNHGLLVEEKVARGSSILTPAIISSEHNDNVDAAVYITPTSEIYVQTAQGFSKVKEENGRYKITTHFNSFDLTPINFDVQETQTSTNDDGSISHHIYTGDEPNDIPITITDSAPKKHTLATDEKIILAAITGLAIILSLFPCG